MQDIIYPWSNVQICLSSSATLSLAPPPCASTKVWASDAREGESLILPTTGNAALCRLRYYPGRCTEYRFSSSQRKKKKTWTNLSECFSYETAMQKCVLMTFLFSLPLPTTQMQGMTLLSPVVFSNKTYTCLGEETSELRKGHTCTCVQDLLSKS